MAGRFEVLGSLWPTDTRAAGSYYRVRDHERDGVESALAILPAAVSKTDAAEERLAMLVESARELDHAALLRPHACGRTELGLLFVASELVEGETLRALSDRRGTLHPHHAIEIGRQLLLALEYVHQHGQVHGCLDPTRVLLERRAPWSDDEPFGVAVRILDLGVGRLAARTPGPYTAPELSGGEPADERADVYAVGALVFELLAGAPPAGDGLDHLARPLRTVLARALEPDPSQRYPNAMRLRLALEAVRTANVEAGVRRGTRRAHWLALALLVGLAGVLGMWWSERGRAQAAMRAAETSRSRLEELQSRAPVPAAVPEDLTRELDAAQREAASWMILAEAQQQHAEEAARERDAQRERAEGLAAELGAALERLRVRATPPPAPEPPPDEVGSLLIDLAAGRSARARARWTIAPAELPARDFLGALASGAAALDGGSDELPRARTALTSARAALPAMTEPLGDHAELARGVLEALEERLLVADRGREAEWDALLGGHPERTPAEVRAAARGLNGDRFGEFVQHYAHFVRGTCTITEALDMAALERLTQLDAWRAEVASDPALAATDDGRSLLQLAAARRFHRGEDVPLAELGAASDATWSVELGLRAGLLGADAAWPGPVGARFLYRDETPAGRVSWLEVRVAADPERPADAARSVVLEQRFYDEDGATLGTQSQHAILRGRAWYITEWGAAPVLDLGAPPRTFGVTVAKPRPVEQVPAHFAFSSEQLAAFDERWRATPRPVLVVADGPARRWYSPVLGLVRHEQPGRILRQLVVAELP